MDLLDQAALLQISLLTLVIGMHLRADAKQSTLYMLRLMQLQLNELSETEIAVGEEKLL